MYIDLDQSRIAEMNAHLEQARLRYEFSHSRECRSCGKIADVNADDCCVVCDDIVRES